MTQRQPRPNPPTPLHFIRLAQGSAGQWVTLPDGGLHVIELTGKLEGVRQRGWLLCLKGEAVLDLPEGDFVRLRVGEGYPIGGDWDALPTREGTVLLLLE